jgi:hypothetical protein
MDRWELTETQRNWLADVEACAAGGSSMKAYAEEHGFDLQSFYLWKGRLKKLGFVTGRQGGAPTHSAQLVSIPLAASRQTSARTRIELTNGISIEAPQNIDADMLCDLLRSAMAITAS